MRKLRWLPPTLYILFLLLPIPLLSALVFALCENTLRRLRRGDSGRDWLPFACTVLLFLLAFVGLAHSLFPYLVADRIDYLQAAAATGSLKIMLVGTAITLPVIVGYTIFSYRVFWGRVRELRYE